MTENKKITFRLTSKQKLLLKAFVGGVLITQSFGFSSSQITLTPFWIAFRDFLSHFLIVFVFWLIIPERHRENNWIWAGFLGSLIFSSRIFVIVKMFYELTVPQFSSLMMWTLVIFGGLGAIPQ